MAAEPGDVGAGVAAALSLDLKFVVHHGLIARQRAGRLGIGAYALYTNDCVRIMGLADPALAPG